MQIASTTIAIPVSDIALAQLWYEAVFQLPVPEADPVDGIIEYRVGTIWIQLQQEENVRTSGMLLRFGVTNVEGEHARLSSLGVDVSPIVRVPGAVEFFDCADPDGHTVSFYTVVT